MPENLESQNVSRSEAAEKTQSKSNAGKGVEGERRSFAEGAETSPAMSVAQRATEAGRRLAETGRPADLAELWRTPFEAIPAMQMEMGRLFDEFWRNTWGMGGSTAMRALRPFSGLTSNGLFGQPPADVTETEQGYNLTLEVPGISANDLDLSLEGDTLVVCGHKSEERKEATASYRMSERRFGRFERHFPLTPDINRNAIEARYRDGVLNIDLPRSNKAEKARSKIAIKG